MLYDDISQAYLESIDRARGGIGAFRANDDGSESKEPPWREKKRWLARVGFEMQLRRASKRDSVRAFEGSTRELLFSTEDVCGWLTSAMDLSGYGGGADEAKAFLDWAARRSGLLVPRGEGLHAFMHLSFQEYFAAAFIIEEFKSPDWSSASEAGEVLRANGLHPEITRDNLAAWAGETVWEEVLILAFEQLAHEPRWAERLLKVVFPSRLTGTYGRLASRLLLNPHTGLTHKSKLALRDAVYGLIADHQTFTLSIFGPRDDALSRVWRDPAEREMWLSAFASSRPTKLNMISCTTESFDFLRHFPSLEDLGVNALASGKFEALRVLPVLKHLAIWSLQSSNLLELGSLPQLHSLALRSARLESLDGLENFRGLTRLVLLDCAVEMFDLNLLRRTGIRRLSCAGTSAGHTMASNAKPLPLRFLRIGRGLRFQKKELAIHKNSFVLCLLDSVDVEELELSLDRDDNVEKISGIFAKQPRLSKLVLRFGTLPSLNFVRALPRLRELHIERTQVGSLDALDGLTELEVWVDEEVKHKVNFRSGRGPTMHYVKA